MDYYRKSWESLVAATTDPIPAHVHFFVEELLASIDVAFDMLNGAGPHDY